MSPRRDRVRAGNIADDDEPILVQTLGEADRSIFHGALKDADAGKIVAYPRDIDTILPDITQPRRPIPSAVRRYWDHTTAQIPALFETWALLIQEERAQFGILDDFQLNSLIYETPEEEIEPTESPLDPDALKNRPVELALTTLAGFARDIYSVGGLTNPITVDGSGHIETGERRWLAYHLIRYVTGQTVPWAKIPAANIARSSRWRQAQENGTRQSLNAIAKARQLSLLLMEIFADSHKYTFRSLAEFLNNGDHELYFYRQVADGATMRLPHKSSDRIASAMGLASPGQLRNYRSLLKLPSVAWETADDYNLSEHSLRVIWNNEYTDDKINQMVWNLAIGNIDSISAFPLASHIPPPSKSQRGTGTRSPLERLESTVTKIEQRAGKLQEQDIRQIIQLYEAAAQRLKTRLP